VMNNTTTLEKDTILYTLSIDEERIGQMDRHT
jgi:hypothetical protein